MTGPLSDPLLDTARHDASRGAWGDVRASLERDEVGTERNPSRSMLLAEACLLTGDPRKASRLLDVAAPLLMRAGDRPALRKTINMQGAAAFALGTLDDAAVCWHAALAMAQTDDDLLLSARATNNLCIIAALKGGAEQSIICYQRAIADYQRLGNARGLAESWHNMAISFRTRGELNPAEDAELRAIEFASEISNIRLVMMAQVGRAEVALRRGDASWARAMALRAVNHFASIPDYLLESDARRVHADACGRMGFVAEADRSIVRALELAREHGHRTQEAQALQTFAQLLLSRGDVEGARREGTAAREAFSKLGSVTAADEMASFLAALSR